jgi:hypothetical protein
MQTDVGQTVIPAPPYAAVRNPVAQAVADLARPHSSMLDHVAARGRLREVLTSYVRTLRADGATPSDILAATNAVARRALSGVAPTRVATEIRDAIRRWVLAAYDRAD